ncbi:unnamed protein product [Brassica napus]|uniref:(rape) hypothetical protein n=1 Tax=Brassica napus TaxID=3708 RepID=A0A816IAV4_BRANA|nr:unnamed protein product [Brassica napus]
MSLLATTKHQDPAYMIRTVSTNASNTVYFRLLAQSVVHGAVAGPKDIIKEKKELPEKPLLKVKTVMEFSIFLWLLKINK